MYELLMFIVVVVLIVKCCDRLKRNSINNPSHQNNESQSYQNIGGSKEYNESQSYQNMGGAKECNENQFYQNIGNVYEYLVLSLNRFSKQINLLRDISGKCGCEVSEQQLASLFCKIYVMLEDCENISDINNHIYRRDFEKIFLEYYGKMCPSIYSSHRGRIDALTKIFWNESMVNALIEAFIIDNTSDRCEGVENCLDYVKSNTSEFEAKIGLICASIMGNMISFIKLIHIAKYIPIIQENEDLFSIINHTSTSVEEKYNIYKEFYSDIISEELNVNEFEVLINIVNDYEEDSIECVKYLFETIGLDINKLIVESTQETLYRDFDNIYRTPGFDYLMKENMVDIFFVSYLPYFLIQKTSMKKWMLTLFEQDDFLEKINIYLKKSEILRKAKTPKIEIFKDRYRNIDTGEEFEIFLKELYEELGFQVTLTPTTGDQGADLIIEKHGVKSVIQAKFYSSSVGNSAVQEVIGAIGFYNANKGIVITNNTFTKSAKELAKANNIHLVNGNSLITIMETVI